MTSSESEELRDTCGGVEANSEDNKTHSASEDEDQRTVKNSKCAVDLIHYSRTIVFLVILVSAVAVSSLAYYLLKRDEREDFEEQFKQLAKEVVQLALNNARNTITSVASLATLYTSFAVAQGDILPFVTIDDFEAFGSKARQLAKAEAIVYLPLLKTEEELDAWNQYSTNNTQWIPRSRLFTDGENTKYSEQNTEISDEITPYVYRFNPATRSRDKDGLQLGPASPMWQMTPIPGSARILNINLANDPVFFEIRNYTIATFNPILSEQSVFGTNNALDEPDSVLLYPVVDQFSQDGAQEVVGHIMAMIPWRQFFSDVLHEGQSCEAIIESCEKNTSWVIKGSSAEFMGYGDHHNKEYDYLVFTSDFVSYEGDAVSAGSTLCKHRMYLFPARGTHGLGTRKPLTYAGIIIAIFLFTATAVAINDLLTTRRQAQTEHKAQRTGSIVQELFPGDVAAQLLESGAASKYCFQKNNGVRKKNIARGSDLAVCDSRSAGNTIAQLYPAATVLFADIAGFTAWSSIRQPQEVFTLLEAIFQSFDALGKRFAIFKVETIGDCYVAVCGLPKQNLRHAATMAKFAISILTKFNEVVRGELASTLGPDTIDLAIRIGIHSGPVTAGVLRGERARFQLFGDTVNTASRIETTGSRHHIHMSEETAQELTKCGHKDWFVRREDKVKAKGKGIMQTYWLLVSDGHGSSNRDEAKRPNLPLSEQSTAENNTTTALKSHCSSVLGPLVDWNASVLLHHLKVIVARRRSLQGNVGSVDSFVAKSIQHAAQKQVLTHHVEKSIEMPESVGGDYFSTEVELAEDVTTQVRHYVSQIASMYKKDNAFHNFEHATHVTMSVSKLLCRIISPHTAAGNVAGEVRREHAEAYEETDGVTWDSRAVGAGHEGDNSVDDLGQRLHAHSYGIASDPLIHFACIFSAMIHDVGHRGCSNSQLIREEPDIAKKYENKSVAEKNAIDLAWTTLLLPQYEQLRSCIFGSVDDVCRFRKLLCNSVVATDIFDKDLALLRTNRCIEAFQNNSGESCTRDETDQRATLVIEHLLQASDIAHTFQHFVVYRKWNQRLFYEMYSAYAEGRAERDPSIGWYERELNFFDEFVLPLASRLQAFGVFGVSGDEYFNYATKNRQEWLSRGKQIVEEWEATVNAKFNASIVSQSPEEPVSLLESARFTRSPTRSASSALSVLTPSAILALTPPDIDINPNPKHFFQQDAMVVNSQASRLQI